MPRKLYPLYICLTLCSVLAVSGCEKKQAGHYSGYAEGEFVLVAAPAAGRLEKRWVQRGQEVKAGAPLFILEQENEKASRREAEARLRTADARLSNLTRGRRPSEIDALIAGAAQADAAKKLSLTQLERFEKLFASGYISREQLDEARTANATNTARVAEAEARLRSARESLGRDKEIEGARTEVEAASAALAQSNWRLSQRAAHAPSAALVYDTFYSEGEWVPAGSPVVSLLPPGNLKFRFYVPETVAGSIKPGQTVQASCDGCGKPMTALVSYISRQPEYTPPVIYSRDQRTRLVFLVEAIPGPEYAGRVNPGQPVDIWLKWTP
ncbi:MAG: HlyD family efflux transporter periplasmic adaptor subunit [Nitrospirae bacterium]|nr:HlyD family efflux transporter periplasmic adaptor subunit [Nitrospirota bacterium]